MLIASQFIRHCQSKHVHALKLIRSWLGLTFPWGARRRGQAEWVAAAQQTVHCRPQRTAAALQTHCCHPAASSRTCAGRFELRRLNSLRRGAKGARKLCLTKLGSMQGLHAPMAALIPDTNRCCRDILVEHLPPSAHWLCSAIAQTWTRRLILTIDATVRTPTRSKHVEQPDTCSLGDCYNQWTT